MRARAVDRSRRRRHLLLAVLSAVVAATMAGCMSDPPPPVRETEAPPQTPAEYPTEKTIYVATDSVGQGFNPHLAADQSPVTTAIASMTLPSAFEPVQTPDGVVWQRSEALLSEAPLSRVPSSWAPVRSTPVNEMPIVLVTTIVRVALVDARMVVGTLMMCAALALTLIVD